MATVVKILEYLEIKYDIFWLLRLIVKFVLKPHQETLKNQAAEFNYICWYKAGKRKKVDRKAFPG